MSLKRQAIWSVVVFLIVSVLVVGVRPMIQPDEPRYGIIAAEMAETGQWFALRMAGFHYYEKPPMGYWMMAASIEAFGENTYAIRLPSALAANLSTRCMVACGANHWSPRNGTARIHRSSNNDRAIGHGVDRKS